MLLDMRTLWVVIVIVYALLGGLQLVLWRLQRSETAMLFWGLSLLCCGLGALLVILRGVLPDWLSIGVANVLASLGYLMSTVGLLRFAHRPVAWVWVLSTPVLIGLLFVFVPFFAQHAGPRVVLMAALLVLVAGINLGICWRAQRQEPLRLRQIAMTAFAVTGLFSILRATVTVFYTPPADFMDPSKTQPLLMLIGLALLLFWNLSLMLMPGERLQNQLRRAAQDDALTNLLNRGGFNGLARRQLERCRHSAKPASVLLMDLDHFKRVNDSHGHDAGDRLLCAFAETVRAQSRATDLVARYGGEEFCALLPGADHQAAVVIAERIRQQFAKVTVPVDDIALGTTVSIGVAEIAAAETVEAALLRADQALYAAKREGRNRVTLAHQAG
ncbi:MAG: GGDEF domain-containing protein [Pseudomonadota bacterium]